MGKSVIINQKAELITKKAYALNYAQIEPKKGNEKYKTSKARIYNKQPKTIKLSNKRNK